VGIINLAYFLAKRGLKYDESSYKIVDEYAEAWSYYLIKSSANLAVEKGKAIFEKMIRILTKCQFSCNHI